jgi:hypothetical protein
MWLNQLYQRWTGRPTTRRQPLQHFRRHHRARLTLEQLEDRLVPTNFTAATVADLIADINAANQQGGANTITLAAPTTSPYILTAVNNSTDGVTGLPVIAANDHLAIVGNGDTIARSTAVGTPAFRLFDVAAGASLTLQNLTLQGGYGSYGGAIYNQGAADLNNVIVQGNSALLAGGIFSSGSLTLEGGTNVQNNSAMNGGGVYVAGGTATLKGGTKVQNNYASAGAGGGMVVIGGTVTVTNATFTANVARGHPASGNGTTGHHRPGTNGMGGALYVAGGTVSVTSTTVAANTAQGGAGDPYEAAKGLGGGLCVVGGTVTLHNDTVTGNAAVGGAGVGGAGFGGGLYINGATVCLDAFTHAHVIHNTASTAYPNIDGPYKLC